MKVITREQWLQNAVKALTPLFLATSSLRTTRSQLERLIRDIQHNNFIKFNIHSRLQS
jgi:hypothetical protein